MEWSSLKKSQEAKNIYMNEMIDVFDMGLEYLTIMVL